MKNLILIICLLTSSLAINQTNQILGHWQGKLNIGSVSIRVVFHFEESNGIFVGSMDSPDQGAFGIPLSSLEITKKNVKAEIKQGGIVYKGVWNEKDSIVGLFSQGGKEFQLPLGKVDESMLTKLNRPQEPKAPFPYLSKEVEILNKKDKVTLSGTLTIPEGKGPFPAVILVSGSGPQNRDEEIMGHKPFLVLADYLTRNGIAVLRYDDRGVGKSTGSFSKANSHDLSKDAEAVFNFLRKQKNINSSHVGILGHSEGGMIAPMVAARNKSVDFIILLAGPGIPIDELMKIQIMKVQESEGVETSEMDKSSALSNKIIDILKREKNDDVARKQIDVILDEYVKDLSPEEREKEKAELENSIKMYMSPWFRYFLAFEPKQYLEKVKCPVLAINGEKDIQVTAKENLEAIEFILSKSGNKNVEIHAIPDLNHLFQTCSSCTVSEYVELEETISVKVLELVKEFILK